MQSPIYWHPWLYRTAMKLSYKDQFTRRYEALAPLIPAGAELLELCMGDAYFYRHYLTGKGIRYTCADINPVFVKHARKLGLDSQELDIATGIIPLADHILLQGSLYHFIPNEGLLIQRLLEAARNSVIISESIDNLSNSSSAIGSAIGTWLSKAKTGQSAVKFSAETLRRSLEPFHDHIELWDETPGNREIIIVLKT